MYIYLPLVLGLTFDLLFPGLPPGPPMPRPILPRERTAFDKLVDGLVGDGPQNRYALICSRCYSHNGMALKEEFEYLSKNCQNMYILEKYPSCGRKPWTYL